MTTSEAIIPTASDNNELLIEDKRDTVYGMIKKEKLYARIVKYAPKAIGVIARLMNSKNDNIAFKASLAVLAKTIPDLRTLDGMQGNGNQFNITVNMGNGYNPLSESTIVDIPTTDSTNVSLTPNTPLKMDYTRSQAQDIADNNTLHTVTTNTIGSK